MNGKPVSVFAGASSTDPNQGEIFILIYDGIAQKLLTPTKHGGVRVVSEQEMRALEEALKRLPAGARPARAKKRPHAARRKRESGGEKPKA